MNSNVPVLQNRPSFPASAIPRGAKRSLSSIKVISFPLLPCRDALGRGRLLRGGLRSRGQGPSGLPCDSHGPADLLRLLGELRPLLLLSGEHVLGARGLGLDAGDEYPVVLLRVLGDLALELLDHLLALP